MESAPVNPVEWLVATIKDPPNGDDDSAKSCTPAHVPRPEPFNPHSEPFSGLSMLTVAWLRRLRLLRQSRPEVARRDTPVRVLVNGIHANSGGAVTYLNNILPLLAADPNVDVHLCVRESQPMLLDKLPDQVTCHVINVRSNLLSVLIREQIDIPRLARRIGSDVVFSPANYGPILAPGLVILLRNALDVGKHDRRPSRRVYWLLHLLATVISVLVCRRSIAVSDYARRMIPFPFSRKALRSAVIPHGINPMFSPRANDDDEIRTNECLLSVSDVYIQKNYLTLINAFEILHQRYPTLRLQIVGTWLDHEYLAELQNLAEKRGVSDFVEFLGKCSPQELVMLYRDCKVFVFPSFVETFGQPLVEAMACGAAIASSNTAAMPEVLGDAAIYFDPFDAGAIADTVSRILDDPDLCHELKIRASVQIQKYSWSTTAQHTLKVIRDAASIYKNK